MLNHNSRVSSAQDFLDDRLDAIRSQVKKLVDQVSGKDAKSRISSFASKATDMVREHPIAAAGIALGVGYLVVRIARR